MHNTGFFVGTITALVGEAAREKALSTMRLEMDVCSGQDIPFFPQLGIRQNAVNIKMVLSRDDANWFWELLRITGLRRPGWTLPFRKDKPGTIRLWELVLGLIHRPPSILVINPLEGMDSNDREHFSNLLQFCREKGISVFYTESKLKEAMALGISQRVLFAQVDSWHEINTEQIERDALIAQKCPNWNKIQQGLEG